MLTSTFCHLPGVGPRTEVKLWDEGILSWDICLEMQAPEFRGSRAHGLCEHLYESVEALESMDALYFGSKLPAAQTWRMFPEFRSRVAYLDIETTGLGYDGSDGITTIALYDGKQIRHYVQGENLRDFRDDIFEYDLLVTYNGKSFDVPFIENYFGIRLPHAHIDLRYVLASLGLKGGLKGIERQLGIERGDLEDVDGYFAVLLWYDYYNRGNALALDTLLAYNIEDTVNLERLMTLAYNMKVEQTPFAGSHLIRSPVTVPVNPFTADRETIERIRREFIPVNPWG